MYTFIYIYRETCTETGKWDQNGREKRRKIRGV